MLVLLRGGFFCLWACSGLGNGNSFEFRKGERKAGNWDIFLPLAAMSLKERTPI
jgi:hypothetical protein